ncbi:MAG: hypothetical protein WBR18_03895, partial [Anaerolineales bacterium]
MSLEPTRPIKRDDETRPNRVADDVTQPVGTGAAKPPENQNGIPWRLLLALAGAAAIILGLAAASGYYAGTQERDQIKATEQGTLLQEQFDLGVQDLELGRLQVAKQRFEHILSVDPEFPGARDLLTLAQQGLNEPTFTPSPTATEVILTPTATISLESLEGLYEAARDAVNREGYDEAIEILLSLRRKDPNYRLDEVNALFFTAYRNRGMAKIFRKELEPGIYDLTMASRVGTLDSQAQSWQRSAAFYQFANSFIGLDWQQAVVNFADLCAAGIWDSCYKYARSAAEYGSLLAKDGEYCAAVGQFDASLTTRDDAAVRPTATFVFERCLTATTTPMTPTPTGTWITGTPGTPTPTTTPPIPSETATVGPPTETQSPATATAPAPATATPMPSAAATVEGSPTPTSS